MSLVKGEPTFPDPSELARSRDARRRGADPFGSAPHTSLAVAPSSHGSVTVMGA
jgi:hypothetical protein